MVKKSTKIIAYLAALIMLIGAAYAVVNRNQAEAATMWSQHDASIVNIQARPVSAQPASEQAYTSVGSIRPADNPGFCLTRTIPPRNGFAVFVLPCVNGFGPQQWFAWRIPQIGGINVHGSPDFEMGKLGASNNVQLILSTKPGKYVTALSFTPYEKGWLIDVKQGKVIKFFTLPAKIKRGGKQINVTFAAGSSRKTQEFIFTGAWKRLES
jgi:hypothetical protein